MKIRARSIFTHIILSVVSILSIFPFLWLISTSLKSGAENIFAYPPNFIPQDCTFENYIGVWGKVNFLKYFFNSAVVAVFTVLFNLLFSSMAAYPLARMEFKGKRILFFAVLATIMVPFQAIMLPIYLIILKMNLLDSVGLVQGYLGLILPFAVNAFGIFLMRQAFLSIPREVEEAAIVDGCNSWEIFFQVLLPMTKPTLAILAIFTFTSAASRAG